MLITLLLGANALAFGPTDDTYIGIEPVRIMRFHSERQHVLRHGAGWQSFLRGDGAGWNARFDEQAGTVYSAWGPGIEMGAISSEVEAGAAVLSLLSQYPDLVGVPMEDLSLSGAGYDAQRDLWIVHIDRSLPLTSSSGAGFVPESTPTVWRGGVQAHIKHGRLIHFQIATHPDATGLDTAPQITRDDALAAAIAQGPAPLSWHDFTSAELRVLPLSSGRDLEYRLAYEVRTETAAPLGQWVSFIDASSGELLNVHNEIRFLSGTVEAEHDTRTVNGDISYSYLSGITLSSNTGASATTNSRGEFTVDGDAAEAVLDGDLVDVRNSAGGEGSLYVDGDATFTSSSATQAEIDTYVFISDVLQWADTYAPHINSNWGAVSGRGSNTVISTVNINSSCNAYYDGQINFYAAGSGCNNTGRIADVNYHEWGHGFHYVSVLYGGGSNIDGSISEGIGDTIAFFLTGDSTIAPYFQTNGSGIREVSSNRSYPDDFYANDSYVHSNGLIFGGSVWDTWAELEEEMSAADAAETLYDLLPGAIMQGPDIPESFDAFVVADDDNGDLGDGTPNLCALIEGFGQHGLGPGGSGEALISMSHLQVDNQGDSAAGTDISADFLNLAESCLAGDLSGAAVVYSTDGGETWSSSSLSASSSSLEGIIPAQDAGTVVEYYIEGETNDGDAVYVPQGGEITPLSYFVGELEEIYCNDFERDDGDFTSALLDGEESEGADDWMWGIPAGLEGDPSFGASGDRVWGNDLGGTINGQPFNGAYQAEKHNQLLSPEIDVSGYDGPILVQFQRWLTVEDGYWDKAYVTINDERVWSNHATGADNGEEHHQDSQWARQSHLLDAPESGTVQIGWELKSDQGLHFGGWNIDDVCVYAVVLPDGGENVDGNDGDGSGSGSDGLDGDGGDDWSAFGCSATGGAAPAGLLLGLLAAFTRRRRRS